MYFEQAGFVVRFDWGEAGIRALAAGCDTLVIVDVLSFTTAVDMAVARGAAVVPFPYFDARAEEFARQVDAVLAVPRTRMSEAHPYSLSPPSLAHIAPGTRLVLPSPNGSTLTVAAASVHAGVLAGCLRNANAVAHAASRRGGTIGVIAAGERWAGGSLRPAIEDLIGAGAIISQFGVLQKSPEAELALAAFDRAQRELEPFLRECASGRELIEIGFANDVASAAQLNVSRSVPTLQHGAYQDAAPTAPRPTAPGPAPGVAP